MKRLLAIVAAALWCAVPAQASLTRAELADVSMAVRGGASLPVELAIVTADGERLTLGEALGGKPTLLLPLDPHCRVVCGPALSILGDALKATGFEVGRDYRLVLLSIGRPDEDAARALVSAQLGDDWRRSAMLVTGPSKTVRQVTDALGYRFVEDGPNDAIAHPSAFYALTGDARVSRALSSLALNAADLRLALVEAGLGRVGGVGDQLKLLCYGFDSAHGVYTSRIQTALRAGAAGILLAMAGGLWWLSRRGRRADLAGKTGGTR